MESKYIIQLEDLPDELFLLIYRYLNKIEILNSFSCLNHRFSKTIHEFTEEIDLNSIPLKLINRFQNEIFPNIISNIRSIIFSDDFQRFPINFELFPNLESIHFLNSFSQNYLYNVKQIKIDLVPVDAQIDLMKKLFSSNDYSNLKNLSFISYHGSTFSNIQLTNLSQIENLTITLKNNVDLFELLRLLSCSIEKLHIHILYNGPFKSLSSLPLKLDKLHYFHLKTTFEDSIKFKELEKLIIESFSSLQYLSIETLTRDENYINGYQWEKCLKKLIYLKNFICSIRYRCRINEYDDDQQIKEENLLNSFSTDFWLNQRKWFINFYSTISTANETVLTNTFKVNEYRKTFLYTIPYPYQSMDATIDINKTKSTINQFITRSIYSNVRHLYYNGENIPIKLECLKSIFNEFKSINELKLDRLILDSCSLLSHQINLPHLNKLTIYNNSGEKNLLNLNFLNLSSMYNLRYIRIPQISLPDYSQMPKQLETLILTECRDIHFDFIHKYENLRTLKLYLNNFDRLLENNGQLIMNLIKSIYNNNNIMESLQLMCPGANHKKVNIFEKQFNSTNLDYLYAHFDGKCLLAIQRSTEFFNQRTS
ncbi:unnamed protein product [Adineta steineri]|uniref:F-box domain-containing protein n=1 Tax=Adineta steineri TaxID=433720 RepID=A0A814FFJ7_9BILA|nr:unnamed protein product [Adineta steineri]CAF3886831.1 unnamed protein product [Adineta steineri]